MERFAPPGCGTGWAAEGCRVRMADWHRGKCVSKAAVGSLLPHHLQVDQYSSPYWVSIAVAPWGEVSVCEQQWNRETLCVCVIWMFFFFFFFFLFISFSCPVEKSNATPISYIFVEAQWDTAEYRALLTNCWVTKTLHQSASIPCWPVFPPLWMNHWGCIKTTWLWHSPNTS